MSKYADVAKFLCPEITEDSFLLKGDFYAQEFEFIRIQILGCDLVDEDGNDLCAPDEEVNETIVSVISTKALPTVGSDKFETMATYSTGIPFLEFLNVDRQSNTNLFYMQSTVSLENNQYNPFETNS